MTTLIPRPPYTDVELQRLYPSSLELVQVQILARHGERTPVSARFQNAGLRPYWPYCHAVRHLRAAVLDPRPVVAPPSSAAAAAAASVDEEERPLYVYRQSDEPHTTAGAGYTTLEWRRRLEGFSPADDGPAPATGPGAEVDGICDMGSLTDQGRASTFALGQRLRALYVHRLAFLPRKLPPDGGGEERVGADKGRRNIDSGGGVGVSRPAAPTSTTTLSSIYLRSTPVPRAIESLQQIFLGLYPPETRGPATPPQISTTIITRPPPDETLYPNDSNCRRLSALARAFASRAAERHNGTEPLAYVTRKLGRWMPPGPDGNSPQPVAVDGRPRLVGVMDTVNATLAHPRATRLPAEFYDKRVTDTLARVAVDEWFAGYRESAEYRALGIGSLLGDVVGRMVCAAEEEGEVGERKGKPKTTTTTTTPRFALSGCHDTTLAATLASLGALPPDEWPPFTSHVAVELFREGSREGAAAAAGVVQAPTPPPAGSVPSTGGGASSSAAWPPLLRSLFGLSDGSAKGRPPSLADPPIGRTSSGEMTPTQRARLDGYYVRLRYNDEPVAVPGCGAEGRHREGDETLCTLVSP